MKFCENQHRLFSMLGFAVEQSNALMVGATIMSNYSNLFDIACVPNISTRHYLIYLTNAY
jgi:hypothetical protein